jgi:isopentenyl phosphate kinase
MTRVLKIGGSILTDKTQAARARPGEIERVAREIAERFPKVAAISAWVV